MRIPVRLALLATACLPVSGTALAANDCSFGPPTTTGNVTSFLFDDFSVTAGGTTGSRNATSSCKTSVPLSQEDGHSVFTMDYRGFATTDSGQTVSLSAFKDGKEVLKYELTGPLDEDLLISDKIGVSGSDAFDLETILTAAGPLDDAAFDAALFIDTLDFKRIGFTTSASVRASMNQIARQRQSIAVGLMDISHNLLGQSERFDEGSFIGAFASSDAAAGFNGRWEAGSGVSLFGGAALVNPNGMQAVSDTLALLAGGVRYTTPQATWRAFGEAGAWGSPNVSASLSRSYVNLDEMIFTGGTTSGSLFASYARLGVIYAPDDVNELALSTRFTRSWLNLDGYDEEISDKNLFAAHMKSGRSRTDTVSAELAWSRKLDEKFDYTLSGAVGRTFAGRNGAKASVDWVGDVSGDAEDQNFAMVGGRIGWKLDESWQLNTSVSATFRESEKPALNIGGQLKTAF